MDITIHRYMIGNESKLRQPNLWRVAEELSRYQDPYRVADLLLSTLERGGQNAAHGNQDFGLLLGDIFAFADQSH